MFRIKTAEVLCLVYLISVVGASAQGVITTFAGTDYVFKSDGKPAAAAPLGTVYSVATDRQGNVYATCQDLHLIVKIDRSGTLSVVAGNGLNGISGDGGPALSASLQYPGLIAIDPQGTIYFVDGIGSRIRKITSDGVISTLALIGNGQSNSSGLAVDSAASIYLSESFGHRVLKVDRTGNLTVAAGTGTSGYTGDNGPARLASLSFPRSLATDATDNLFILDQYGSVLRKVDRNGTISTVPNSSSLGLIPRQVPSGGMAIDPVGNIYVNDCSDERIRRLGVDGRVTVFAGNGQFGFSGDSGPATSASYNCSVSPGGGSVALDPSNSLYLADTGNLRVRKITGGGIISTFAGNGQRRTADDGEPALAANLDPISVAFSPLGELYIADRDRIAKVTSDGRIFTVFNSPAPGYRSVIDLVFAPDGTLYAILQYAGVIRINGNGGAVPFAGNGLCGSPAEGAVATQTSVCPDAITADKGGRVLIAQVQDNKVYAISPAGIVTTFAGADPVQDPGNGNGGPALHARLSQPRGLAVDALGNVYIGDGGHGAIRKVTPDGTITSVNKQLIEAGKLALDFSGNLYTTGSNSSKIYRVDPNGETTLFAGTGRPGFSGDGGPATQAQISSSVGGLAPGIAADAAGNVFFADNQRIRVVLAEAPVFANIPDQIALTGRSAGAVVSTDVLVSSTSGLNSDLIAGMQFQVSSSADWLTAVSAGLVAPSIVQLRADPSRLDRGVYIGSVSIYIPLANPTVQTVQVSFTVNDPLPPDLAPNTNRMSFTYTDKSTARSQVLRIVNAGSGSIRAEVIAETDSGGAWLKLENTSGLVGPDSPLSVTVTASPTGFPAGTYTGRINILGVPIPKSVAVAMTISQKSQVILLSQSGLSFTSVERGGTVPPQSFGVINAGTGVLKWTASPSTLSGGNWLIIDRTEGISAEAPSPAPTVQVRVNAARLPAGKYYGLVQVRSDGTANTPQVVTVFLEVLPENSNPGPGILPAEIVFVATSGNSPGAQELLVYNATGTPRSFRSSRVDQLIDILPQDGTVPPDRPLRIIVQPVARLASLGRSLPSGVTRTALTLQFDDGRIRTIPITLSVYPPPPPLPPPPPPPPITLSVSDSAIPAKTGIATISGASPAADASCAPSSLIPSMVTLPPSFSVSAGWPVGLEVQVKDDCGGPLTSGTVVVSFSSGEPPLSLRPLLDGRWQSTWQPNSAIAPQVTLTINAEDTPKRLKGVKELSGVFRSPQEPPVFGPEGVASAVTMKPFVPLAPGALITVAGQRLAETNEVEDQTRQLPFQAGGASVLMAGRQLPLLSVSETAITAIVPFQTEPNTSHYLLVQRGSTYSTPVSLDVAAAQPVILTARQGISQGEIYVVRQESDRRLEVLADNGHPGRPGDRIVIYCAGLGAVSPAVEDGVPAPGSPPAKTVQQPEISIGRVSARVLSTTLAPGRIGVYQVEALIPDGVSSGAEVPVILRTAGQQSPEAAMAIQ